MSNLTLSGWLQSVATGVVESVPLQDLESALVLAENFLASQGGWNPDDEDDPTGTGEPASGVSTEEAIELITIEARERIYRTDVSGVLNFQCILEENLSTGLDDETVLANLQDRLDQFLQDNLAITNVRFVSVESYTGSITSGPTTDQDRRDIQQTLTDGGQINDPSAIGLSVARSEYNLDNTYNVEYLYTEPEKQIYVQVIKYTDTLYETVDTSAENRYGIYLDSTSYQTAGGVVLPPE